MFVCNQTNEVCIVGGEILSITANPDTTLTSEDGDIFHQKVDEYNDRMKDMMIENSGLSDWSYRKEFSNAGIKTFVNPLQFKGDSIHLKHCVYISSFHNNRFDAIDSNGNEITILKRSDYVTTGDDLILINQDSLVPRYIDPIFSTNMSAKNPESPLDTDFYSSVLKLALPSLVMDVVNRIDSFGHIDIPISNHYDFKFCRFNKYGLEYKKTGLLSPTKQFSWKELSVKNVAADPIVLGYYTVRTDLFTNDSLDPIFSFDNMVINPPNTNAKMIASQKEKAHGLFQAVIPSFIHYMGM